MGDAPTGDTRAVGRQTRSCSPPNFTPAPASPQNWVRPGLAQAPCRPGDHSATPGARQRLFILVKRARPSRPNALADRDEVTVCQDSGRQADDQAASGRAGPGQHAGTRLRGVHRQPVLALYLSPTEEEAGRLPCYWQTRGDNLPLEVIVLAHRAVVAPLVNHIWTYSGPVAPVSRLDADRDPPGDRGPALVAALPPQRDRGPVSWALRPMPMVVVTQSCFTSPLQTVNGARPSRMSDGGQRATGLCAALTGQRSLQGMSALTADAGPSLLAPACVGDPAGYPNV